MSAKFVFSKANVAYKSSSVQIELQDFDPEVLMRFQQTLDSVDDNLLYFENGPDDPKEEYGKEDLPHITVFYGLTGQDETEAIVEFLRTQPPFKITFSDVSLFEGHKDGREKPYDVVKIEIDSEDLKALHEELGARFEAKGVTFPDYNPHATLAYVAAGSLRPEEVDNFIYGEVIIVDRVHLSLAGNGGNIEVQLEGQYEGEVLLSALSGGTPLYPEEGPGEEWPGLEPQVADDLDNLFDGSPGEDDVNEAEDESERDDALRPVAASWLRSDNTTPFSGGKRSTKKTPEELESEQFHRDYGLQRDPNRKNDEIGRVAHERALREGKKLELNDYSDNAKRAMVDRIKPIIRGELQKNKSAAIWYTKRYKMAMDILAQQWPQLSKRSEKGLLSAIVGVTSSGVSPKDNLKMACAVYSQYVKTGQIGMPPHIGTLRSPGIAKGLDTINQLKDLFFSLDFSRKDLPPEGLPRKKHTPEQRRAVALQDVKKTCGRGIEGLINFLLTPGTVAGHKQLIQDLGLHTLAAVSGWAADTKVPVSTVLLGPKVGNFFANLSGYVDVVTTDDWFAREFNEHRGQLLKTPLGTEAEYAESGRDPNIEVGMKKFKRMIGHPEYSDADALEIAKEYADRAKALGYKGPEYKNDEVMKYGNGVWKSFTDPRSVLRGTPAGVEDRRFMQAVVDQLAKEILAESGDNLSASAIQAILWVYTRRKYAMLRGGTKGNEDFYDGAVSLIGNAQDSPLDFAINPESYEQRPVGKKGKMEWYKKEGPSRAANAPIEEDREFEPDEEEEQLLDEKTGMAM